MDICAEVFVWDVLSLMCTLLLLSHLSLTVPSVSEFMLTFLFSHFLHLALNTLVQQRCSIIFFSFLFLSQIPSKSTFKQLVCSSSELILLPITSVDFVMTNTHSDYFAILSFKSIESTTGYQMSIYFFPIKPYLYGYFLYLLWIIFSLLHQRSFISGAMNCDFRFSTAVKLCHPSSNAVLQINLTQRGTDAEFKYITLTCLLCHV